jgi:hypothetical protein
MRKIVSTYIFSWALGFLLIPTAYAETGSTNNDYRTPQYDKIDFKAEQSGASKVSMSWSAFAGQNDETFEYYKVIRSYSNPNPVYPEDNAMAVKSEIGDLSHIDQNAWKSAYYRVCAITNVKGRYCSNVIWIEIEKMEAAKCDAESESEACAKQASVQKKKEEAREVWEKKQEEAKARLDAKKQQTETAVAKKKEAVEKKKVEVKTEVEAKKVAMTEEREKQQAALYAALYAKLDMWLEDFGTRLEESSLTSVQKVERIEMIQERFATWKEGKTVRVKMVAYLDETLNEWKEKYSAGNDFEEIDAFLDGLFD